MAVHKPCISIGPTSGQLDLNSDILQAIWDFACCLLQALLVCFYPRDLMRNPVPTSYRDWHGHEEPTEWRHFDTSTQLCFLKWLHLEFSCAWKCLSAFCYAFLPYLMFFIIDNQRGILSYQILPLHCRVRTAWEHNLCSHLLFCMDSFVLWKRFFFLQIGVYNTK